MIARAPGKIVISGAYAVLEGAPAIVTAVDRYAVADSTRPAEFVTPEVRAALGERRAPFFDASALREKNKKIGLGSSAAILVASLGAVLATERHFDSDRALREQVLDPAIAAHRAAQGGGSGVDVATSTLGGTIVAQRTPGSHRLAIRTVELPAALSITVLAAGVPASTSELVRRVLAWKAAEPNAYRRILDGLAQAAADAETGFSRASAAEIVEALSRQLEGLAELGRRTGALIVTPEVTRLAELAAREGAVVLPAGAGGGDIALAVGANPPSSNLLRAFDAEQHGILPLHLAALGLHRESA